MHEAEVNCIHIHLVSVLATNEELFEGLHQQEVAALKGASEPNSLTMLLYWMSLASAPCVQPEFHQSCSEVLGTIDFCFKPHLQIPKWFG